MTGIEPAYSAWEAISTPERTFALRLVSEVSANANTHCTSYFALLSYACGAGQVRGVYAYGSVAYTGPIRDHDAVRR
jgi:hypothetical protein